jgi:hypothetical protein
VGPSPATNDYSFVWPTKKYRDATGHLEVRFSGSTNVPVQVPVTLANGNLTDFEHAPGDWASFLPGGWTGASDPVIAAVGDGPDDRPTANAVAASIGVADPPLFLFLGDIYEKGTFTENLNMYGVSSLDVPTGERSGASWPTRRSRRLVTTSPRSPGKTTGIGGRPSYRSRSEVCCSLT